MNEQLDDVNNSSTDIGAIRKFFDGLTTSTPIPDDSGKTTRKRRRSSHSPQSTVENMTLELDSDTPTWAKTMVNNIHRMFITLEKDHSQAI